MSLSEALVLAWDSTRSSFIYIFFLSLGTSLFVSYRLYSILCTPYALSLSKNPGLSTRSLAVFLGSGGHTTEALTLVSSLDFDKFSPRTYIISDGDSLSAKKAIVLENLKKPGNSEYRILTMPRARRVHQSLASTPFTAFHSLVWTLRFVTLPAILSKAKFADALLINGPGTCVALVLVAYFNRFWWLESPRIIYVESFARVNHLSLSGKLVRPLADRFLVQWPNLAQTDCLGLGTSHHRGWLV
ncbi:putative UDP-N-acetylglucosamine transferase subunit Alg14-like protein [Rhizoctonia solani 123E]|uniref:UDP-N-acetylglucosamine transferase subunit ALG14 n=1 Tax=Rhizoctonia solani 123E TaxID=1423351 RepID=A0A074RN50_9AGAM|nr:putative UDP-N-acetylglucosamine transferase subunit Alg14-like protein [Rhizoctonia solani 123E]